MVPEDWGKYKCVDRPAVGLFVVEETHGHSSSTGRRQGVIRVGPQHARGVRHMPPRRGGDSERERYEDSTITTMLQLRR
jgi:hypothetical protein